MPMTVAVAGRMETRSAYVERLIRAIASWSVTYGITDEDTHQLEGRGRQPERGRPVLHQTSLRRFGGDCAHRNSSRRIRTVVPVTGLRAIRVLRRCTRRSGELSLTRVWNRIGSPLVWTGSESATDEKAHGVYPMRFRFGISGWADQARRTETPIADWSGRGPEAEECDTRVEHRRGNQLQPDLAAMERPVPVAPHRRVDPEEDLVDEAQPDQFVGKLAVWSIRRVRAAAAALSGPPMPGITPSTETRWWSSVSCQAPLFVAFVVAR
jgi:hypothetical protein